VLRELAGALLFASGAAALLALSHWMQHHDWEYGRQRSAGIAVAALALFALRWPWRPLRLLSTWPALAIAGLCALGALWVDVRAGQESLEHARLTGEIRLDQGQNLLRAAQLLRRGDDPYGRGALIDLEAFINRRRERAALQMNPALPPGQVFPALNYYGRSPDRSVAEALLPKPAPGAPEAAQREYSLLGHKYGPLPVLVTLPFVSRGPACVPALQLAAFLLWIAALAWALRAPVLRLAPAAVLLALALVLAEPQVARNYLFNSASDAWGLGFCALALGAQLRGKRTLAAVAAALALGCKMFPAALFAPLLLAPWPPSASGARQTWLEVRRALLAFAGVLALLYGPFLLWDARGLWLNIVAWPSLMGPDNTGWLFYATQLAPAARAGLLLLIGALSLWNVVRLRPALAQRPPWKLAPVDATRLFGHFALVSTCAVLAGSAFHNNYVPWVTSWAFCSLAATFGSSGRGFAAAATDGSASAAPQSPQAATKVR